MFGDQKKELEKIEELLREIQLSNEHLADNRPFEPPPGYAWGHANLPELWKGNSPKSPVQVVRSNIKEP